MWGEKMKFTKMHGCGNDYIYINGFCEEVKDPSDLSIRMSNRNFGVGSDGLVLILPSKVGDFRMRMFNSDGSESEMCGNAVRCVGKYVYDNKLTDKRQIAIETLAGLILLDMTVKDDKVTYVRVDMGEPILDAEKIPVISKLNPVINERVNVNKTEYKLTCLSMGNPHAITFVDSVDDLPIEEIGPMVETNEIFPRKTNVEFVQVVSRNVIKMRVWERGAGETLACGTGACATLVGTVLNNLADRKATLKLIGGDLIIEWDEKTNHVFMSGPAETVFEGVWLLG
jgi:diaminopimelate epimerase